MWYIVWLLVIIWIIVIYLSLDNEKSEIDSFDYTKVDFYSELNSLEIRNEKIINFKNKVQKYIIWTDNLINSIIVSILANGHIIVEWVPWLAKTRTILVVSKLLWLDFKRIQFTPDMLPSDVIGGEIYNKNNWKFEVFKGPIFTNLLLADEINRATPKVQSALLEAMQERKVTIWNKTFELDTPFFVMATQNPLEQEWTFPLPEAQLDRFLFKVLVSYPSKEEEKQILDSFDKNIEDLDSLLSKNEISSIQSDIEKIDVPENIKEYIINIVNVTREENQNIEVWASTRASIALKKASQVVAYLEWRQIVEIEDVKKVVLPILRHRVKLSYNALSQQKSIEEILIRQLIKIKDL